MAKRQSTAAEAIAPWLDDVQHVSVESIETRETLEWPASLGINIEATALGASTYRGDQVVVERLAKFSANGSLAARFLYGGEVSIDSSPTPADWMEHSGITLRGASHEALAFTDWTGVRFIRSGRRLIEIGHDTYDRDFAASVTLPGGTIVTENGAIGIGVGVPGAALHVAAERDQVRVEHPEGGAMLIEVDRTGGAHFAPASGETTIYGQTTTDTLNASAVNVKHLHNSTQVLDSTLSLSGFLGLSAVSGYVMADVVGTAWELTGSFMSIDTYERDVQFVVAERVSESGVQMFEVGQTVTFAWLDRTGATEVIQTLSVVIQSYDGRDVSTYPARQTYTFHQTETNPPTLPDPLDGGDVLAPERAIVAYGGQGALSVLNGKALLTMNGPTMGAWHDDYRGIKSENGLMTMKMGYVGLGEADDVEFIKVVDNYGAVTNFELTSSVGLTKGAKLFLRGGTLPSPTTRLAFDGGANTLSINASTLQVDGVDVTLSGVVPNTAPSAGQILVGNAGGTAYAPVAMSGDATLASTGALTIANNAVSLGKMAQMATASLLGRSTAGTGNVEVLSAATVKTLLSLNNVENTALSTWAGSSSITTVGTLAGVTVGGNITVGGTGRRIIGDFTNATLASRVLVQNSTDAATSLGVLGGGATRNANVAVFYGNAPDNTNYATFAAQSSSIAINSTKAGTGTVQPLRLQVDAATKIELTAAGEITLTPTGTTTNTGALSVSGTTTVGGASNVTQLTVKAHASQGVGVPHLILANSSGTELARISVAGTENTFIGKSVAGSSISGGGYNAAVGNDTMTAITSALGNMAFGYSALKDLTSGQYNVGIGVNALRKLTTASENLGIGESAGYNVTGNYNIAIGRNAYYGVAGSTTGQQNTLVGSHAGYVMTSASYNVGVGVNALRSASSGGYNTAVGVDAGYSIATNTGGVFIGYQAGYYETNGSRLYIANGNTTTPLIYGEFPNTLVKVHADFDVQTGKVYKLNGTQLLTARKTGWAAWTGTAQRATKDTGTATLADVAQTLKALLDDLIGHGLIGA